MTSPGRPLAAAGMPAARAHVLLEERTTSLASSDSSSLTNHLSTNDCTPRARTCGRVSPGETVASRTSPSGSSGGSPCGPELSPYEQLLQGLHHDERWLKEVTLGKRVGLYRFRGELGSGNFSQVKLAVHQLTRERVAIKLMDKNRLDEKTRKMLSREIATMEAIHHPNIIRLYEVVETYTRIHLVTEYASGGELYSRVTQAGRLSESEAKPIFAQLISAVSYMHDRNFIHRDLKAENVLFASSGWHVKVVDLGFSTQLNAADQRLSTFSGLKRHILEGEYADPEPAVSPECLSVIRGLLQPVPSDRIPLKHVLADGGWLAAEPAGLASTKAAAAHENLAEEIDLEARKRLAKLGVTETLLQEAQEKGARSAVTGAYRIIAHRVERELTGMLNEELQISSPAEGTQLKSSSSKQGQKTKIAKKFG
ncbi:hypothetical protein B566_EDAN005140 [Ephemera danica]|nr:hypothetical protein B566_EDAN005140 [Ephemera danica]